MCMVGICWFNKWQHSLGHTIFFLWSNTINLHSCSKSGCFCKHWITIREERYRSHIYRFPGLQLDFFPSCPLNKNKMKWLGTWLSVLLQVHSITAFYMRTWKHEKSHPALYAPPLQLCTAKGRKGQCCTIRATQKPRFPLLPSIPWPLPHMQVWSGFMSPVYMLSPGQ